MHYVGCLQIQASFFAYFRNAVGTCVHFDGHIGGLTLQAEV